MSSIKFNFEPDALIEVGRKVYPTGIDQNFLRGCKWSPDGTCLLSVINNAGMSITELPSDLYTCTEVTKERPCTDLRSVINIRENGLIYDFCWYPLMTSSDPTTCCWASSSQHSPIHLWDAFTGELRCTYRGYDAVDEIEAALSLTFSIDGSHLYCGYKKALRIFDVTKPGRDFIEYKVKNAVSCVVASKAQPGLFALGSWNKTIELADDSDNTVRTLGHMSGHSGGVTHLIFSSDGVRLFSGARKDNELICWDLRTPGRPLFSVDRQSMTNQRIYFDLTPDDMWLLTGSTDGILRIWDFSEEKPNEHKEINLNSDCVNSVSCHPFKPIIATGSGQFHFFSSTTDSDSETEKIENMPENNLQIWWCGEHCSS